MRGGWRSLRETMKIKRHNVIQVDTASSTAFDDILGSASRLTSEDKTLKICLIDEGKEGANSLISHLAGSLFPKSFFHFRSLEILIRRYQLLLLTSHALTHSRATVVFKELNTMPRIPASREIVIVQGSWKRSKASRGGRGNANSNLFPGRRGCDDDGCVGGATSGLFLNSNSAPIHALSLQCEQAEKVSLQIAHSPRHRMRSIWK
jgi:hypothetical protein